MSDIMNSSIWAKFQPQRSGRWELLDEMYNVISASDVRPTQGSTRNHRRTAKDQRKRQDHPWSLPANRPKNRNHDYGLKRSDVGFQIHGWFSHQHCKNRPFGFKDLLSVKEAEILVNKIISQSTQYRSSLRGRNKEDALKLRELGCRYLARLLFTKALPERMFNHITVANQRI